MTLDRWLPRCAAALICGAGLMLGGCDDFLLDDDDADWPDYEGEVDLDDPVVHIECIEDVPDGSPEGRGIWELTLLVEGWASYTWVEMWSSGYCEGYDSATGNPCVEQGQERPGWAMDPWDHGWDAELGFWDEWILDLPYHVDISSPESGNSWFSCDMGPGIEFYFCACDDYTDDCYCTDAYGY